MICNCRGGALLLEKGHNCASVALLIGLRATVRTKENPQVELAGHPELAEVKLTRDGDEG